MGINIVVNPVSTCRLVAYINPYITPPVSELEHNRTGAPPLLKKDVIATRPLAKVLGHSARLCWPPLVCE